MPDNQTQCAFCGKTKEEVNKLIASDNASICDECVDKCSLILQDTGKQTYDEVEDVDPHIIKSYLDENIIVLDPKTLKLK